MYFAWGEDKNDRQVIWGIFYCTFHVVYTIFQESDDSLKVSDSSDQKPWGCNSWGAFTRAACTIFFKNFWIFNSFLEICQRLEEYWCFKILDSFGKGFMKFWYNKRMIHRKILQQNNQRIQKKIKIFLNISLQSIQQLF